MMEALYPLLVIAIGLGIGYFLFLRFSRHVTVLGASLRAFIAVLWVLAAIATIFQGFLYAGVALLIVFSSIMFTNAERAHRAATKNDGTRQRIADMLKPRG